ncbi:homeobox protein NANOG [Halichoeres trimaculatus]|uniref:homeobox protein NANOG n=1 Tax=Halichoeres trimaculatus TaxID=147232 RepID=UPI003D9DCB07
MADWKPQISYNYNPSYHAYAYSLVYQSRPEPKGFMNLSTWGEQGDMSSYNPGVTQAYYTPTNGGPEESPPCSPQDNAMSDRSPYQGSGVVYLGDTHAGRLLLSGQHQAAYNSREHETKRTGRDSTSDSEALISPDSWNSGRSREEALPQTDPVTWVKKELDDDTSSRSPDPSEDVSSSILEELNPFVIQDNNSTNETAPLHAPIPVPKHKSTGAASNSKTKVRAAFSESQMNTLVQRFSVQRYLTPAEMKNVAEMTGLTYKQVKTWFQNRRMKLRRHQKDNGWALERYTPIMQQNAPTYQEDVRPQMMQAALKKNPNLAYYLASMSSTAGSAGFPSWLSSTPHMVPTMPNAAGWSMPPSVAPYEYNHNAFGSASVNNTGGNSNFDNKNGEPVGICSTVTPVIVQNGSQ